MKYKIVWIESHDPIKSYKVKDYFEADTIKEAKKIAKKYKVGETGVFAVFDIKGKMVFTEQDFESEI